MPFLARRFGREIRSFGCLGCRRLVSNLPLVCAVMSRASMAALFFVTTTSVSASLQRESCADLTEATRSATLPENLESLDPFLQHLSTSYAQHGDLATFASPSVVRCACNASGVNGLLPHLLRASNGTETLRELLTRTPIVAELCCPGDCGDAARAILSNVTYVLHALLEDRRERTLLYDGVRTASHPCDRTRWTPVCVATHVPRCVPVCTPRQMQQALDRATALHPWLSAWAPLILDLVNRSEYLTSIGRYNKSHGAHPHQSCTPRCSSPPELMSFSVLTDLDILCAVATSGPEHRDDAPYRTGSHVGGSNLGGMPAPARTSEFCRQRDLATATSLPTPLAQCVESVPLYDLTLPAFGARLLDDNLDDESQRADTALQLICGSAPCRALSTDFLVWQLRQNKRTEKAARKVGQPVVARLFDCACDQRAQFTALLPIFEAYANRTLEEAEVLKGHPSMSTGEGETTCASSNRTARKPAPHAPLQSSRSLLSIVVLGRGGSTLSWAMGLFDTQYIVREVACCSGPCHDALMTAMKVADDSLLNPFHAECLSFSPTACPRPLHAIAEKRPASTTTGIIVTIVSVASALLVLAGVGGAGLAVLTLRARRRRRGRPLVDELPVERVAPVGAHVDAIAMAEMPSASPPDHAAAYVVTSSPLDADGAADPPCT